MGHALKRGFAAAYRPLPRSYRAAKPAPEQPSYHSEIDEAYLERLQNEVDQKKPANFNLTPLGEAGW